MLVLQLASTINEWLGRHGGCGQLCARDRCALGVFALLEDADGRVEFAEAGEQTSGLVDVDVCVQVFRETIAPRVVCC